jgi:hypothetical protein
MYYLDKVRDSKDVRLDETHYSSVIAEEAQQIL